MYGPAEPRSYPVVAGLTTVQSGAAAQRRPCPWRSPAPVRQNQNADRRGCLPHRGWPCCSWLGLRRHLHEQGAHRNEQPDPDSTADRRYPGSGLSAALPRAKLRIEPAIAGSRPGFDSLDADDSRRIVRRHAQGPEPGQRRRLMCDRLSKSKDNLITPDEAPAQVEVPEASLLI
jgi:hypothetical protein